MTSENSVWTIRWMMASVSGSTELVASSSSRTLHPRTRALRSDTDVSPSSALVTLTKLPLAGAIVVPLVEHRCVEFELVPERVVWRRRIPVDEIDGGLDLGVGARPGRVDVVTIESTLVMMCDSPD